MQSKHIITVIMRASNITKYTGHLFSVRFIVQKEIDPTACIHRNHRHKGHYFCGIFTEKAAEAIYECHK